MAVRPQQYKDDNRKVAPEPQWQPHYTAAFSEAQISKFAACEYPWVDGSFIRQGMQTSGIEVVLDDHNPMNSGTTIVIKPDGFFVSVLDENRNSEKLERAPFKIFSVSIPLGISKLAITFTSKRQEDGSYRVIQF